VGYEAATTNAIAARAAVPIGSLYQFFPNKSALFNALAARYLAEVREAFGRIAGPSAEPLPLRALIDQVIDGMGHFHGSRPGFESMMQVGRTHAEHMVAVNALLDEMVTRVAELLARHLRPDAANRQLVSTVVVRVADALMVLAAQRGKRRPDPEVLTHLKAMLERYLTPLAVAAPGKG
ncbi:MAG TPA: TetR/AcrR family transcriptional regulator, partial [Myxococcaceae bacterium]|nr:TetR/AcrR family transcriptional regulator [Myxococcaceae bacterium]